MPLIGPPIGPFFDVSGSLEMDVGELAIRSADSGGYADLAMDLGDIGMSASALNVGTLEMDLGGLTMRASDGLANVVRMDLGDIGIQMESGFIIPEFGILEMDVGTLAMYATGLVGNVGSLEMDLGSISMRSSDYAYSDLWMDLGGIEMYAYDREVPVYAQDIQGAVQLPALEVSMSITEGAVITGQIRLPKLTARGYTGAQGRGTLPALTAVGVVTCPNAVTGTVVLPSLQAQGLLWKGGRIRAAIRLPKLRGSSQTGIQGGGELQALTAAGVLTAQETIRATIRLPKMRSTGELSVYGYAITGTVVLPALTSGNRVVGAILLPGITAQAVVTDTSGVFEGWAYNIRTGATTRLTNLPFVQILQVPGEAPLGIGADGNVYQMTGDTDVGAVIPWQIETGLDDMGKPGMKRIPYVYIDGIITGQVELTVLTDVPANAYTYNYIAAADAEHKPHRRKLGNRIRTRNLGFRVASAAGVYVEIDGIEPELDVTQRSV